MKKNKLFVFGISSLIILGVIGLSGNGFARFVPPPGGDPAPPPPPPPDKFGVFFYSTDAGVDEPAGHQGRKTDIQNHVIEYSNILLSKGYEQVFLFEDISSPDELIAAFDGIDNAEDELDAVFFYIWGHGWHDSNRGSGEKNGVKLNWENGEDDRYDLTPLNFRNELNDLDTDNIGFLVESCFSGGFVAYFEDENEPYLAMSTSNEVLPAILWPPTAEGFFSNGFWIHAETTYDNALACFQAAKAWNWLPCPIYYNGLSSFTFF